MPPTTTAVPVSSEADTPGHRPTVPRSAASGGQRAPQRDNARVTTRPSAAAGPPAGPFVALQTLVAALQPLQILVLGTLMNNYPCLARYSCCPVAFPTLLNPHPPFLSALHLRCLRCLRCLCLAAVPQGHRCARGIPPPISPSSWLSRPTRFTAFVRPCHFGTRPPADPHIISARYSLPPPTASHTTPLTWRSACSTLF